MELTQHQGIWWSCDRPDIVEDGYVLVRAFHEGINRGRRVFVVNQDTWAAIFRYGLQAALYDALEYREDGQHLIPRHLVDPEAAEEVARHLDYLSSNEDIAALSSNEDTCSLPTCWQDATDRGRGFPLCTDHAALLNGWDALIEA